MKTCKQIWAWVGKKGCKEVDHFIDYGEQDTSNTSGRENWYCLFPFPFVRYSTGIWWWRLITTISLVDYRLIHLKTKPKEVNLNPCPTTWWVHNLTCAPSNHHDKGMYWHHLGNSITFLCVLFAIHFLLVAALYIPLNPNNYPYLVHHPGAVRLGKPGNAYTR